MDGHLFTLKDKPALRAIYAAVPNEPEAMFRRSMTVMKGAQTGLTVLSMLLQIYIALRFYPAKVGVYYPDRALAAYVSSNRFMPIVRAVPDAYRLLTERPGAAGEGNVLTRTMGDSEVLFLWTSGASITESFPLSVVFYDESQNMMVDDIEKISERMSASPLRWWFMCSTAKWPDADVDFYFKRGTQHRFHTDCGCESGVILDEAFPDCIKFDAETGEYGYVCTICGTKIQDPQVGKWVAAFPDANGISYHFPQTLSATVSPGEIIEAYRAAQDKQNFYNRKLGKPYSDPSQIPITDAVLHRCVELGQAAGVTWESSGRGYYMGIDQMGAYNCVIIRKRLSDGRAATVHVEEVRTADPFGRCDVLMDLYQVAVCVVETLPNFNDAQRFASRYPGRVFLADYGDLGEDIMRWGDEPRTGPSDRRTDESARTRYTVKLDQYKTMQIAMRRLVDGVHLFADPDGLIGESLVDGVLQPVAVLRRVVWEHFKRTALVVEEDPETRKKRRKVLKVGIDPHFSYANMLCDVAWSRAHGTSTFFVPGGPTLAEQSDPVAVFQQVLAEAKTAARGTCGACRSYADGQCTERGFATRENSQGCEWYVAGVVT